VFSLKQVFEVEAVGIFALVTENIFNVPKKYAFG
jgi:hypothetical protein